MTSVWGVSAVAILDSSVNCVCVWSTKKLTMPAYCVAANCNNSQTTPVITMHELPRNRPAVRRKWIKFIQFKRADFLATPHHAHLSSEYFSECDFANPMEYRRSQFNLHHRSQRALTEIVSNITPNLGLTKFDMLNSAFLVKIHAVPNIHRCCSIIDVVLENIVPIV